MASINKVFGILELVDQIVQFLDRSYIFRVVLTNKAVYDVILPWIWHTLNLSNPARAMQFAQSIDAFRALERNIQHVRDFQVDPYFLVHYVDCTGRTYKGGPRSIPSLAP
ncbi:hypothetical protein BGX33_006182 [Mortierella sp. NVP41]|nr:hypothetical protein BGX33_006182 [Mortierella sp. NVP41]